MAELKGWTDAERDVLVQRFVPQLDNVRTDDVTKLCGRMLRRS